MKNINCVNWCSALLTCWTPHFWFASTMSFLSQPMVFLMMEHLLMSSSTSDPTFSLKSLNPSAMNCSLQDKTRVHSTLLKLDTADPPKLDDLLLRVPQPAGRRGVGRQPRAQHFPLPGGLEWLALSEQVQGLRSGDAVLNVAAVEISK